MKAVIFDLDGTLLDTIDDIADSMNNVLRRHGFTQHTKEKYKLFVGDGAAALVDRATGGSISDKQLLMQLENEYRAEYSVLKTNKTVPYYGMAELLSILTKRGVKIAVLSNKPHNASVEVIADYFPGVHFDAVIGQRAGRPVKPSPDGVMEILEILGVAREEVLYVGDTGTDMLTAAAAGLKAVGALWGFRDKDELKENGAEIFAENPLDVLRFL